MIVRALLFLALLTACPHLVVELEGRPCDARGACARGFDCHPGSLVCTPTIERACDGSGVCWSEVDTGASCTVEGSFLPCCADSPCEDGYRTCLEGVWTTCIIGDCTPSEEICDNRDNDCDGRTDVEAVDCVVFFADTDGDSHGDPDDSRCLCVGEPPFLVTNDDDCDDTSACCTDDCSDTNGNETFDCREDTDDDEVCNANDDDDDGDTVADTDDPDPLDNRVCGDADGDSCDDCSVTAGPPDTQSDGLDTDGDGTCNLTDDDDDGDTVADIDDLDPLLASVCRDLDADDCDDCALTGGPPDTANDGTDEDGDGFCAASDCLDDNRDVYPGATEGPLDDLTCSDGLDNDCDGDEDELDAPDCWWSADWTRRVRITFDNSASDVNLNRFPVAIRLDTTIIGFSYDDTMDEGEDLRFLDPGGAPLHYEIERWKESGTSVVWVQVPRIDATSTTDFVWMYFGSDATAGEEPELVWDQSFLGVWHLGEDPGGTAPQFLDSTSNGNHLTAQGTLVSGSRVEGRIGQGVSLSGADSQALRGGNDTLDLAGTSRYTVTAWYFPRGGGGTWHGIFSKGNAQQYALTHNSPSRYLHYETNQGGVGALNTDAYSVSHDDWHHVAIRFNGSGKVIFLDTTTKAMNASTLDSESNTQPFRIGEGNDGELLNGVIDEVRVHAVSRGPDYLEAEYKNGRGELVDFGEVQSR